MKKLTSVLVATLALAFVGCASHHASIQPTQTACAIAMTSTPTVWSALPPEVQP